MGQNAALSIAAARHRRGVEGQPTAPWPAAKTATVERPLSLVIVVLVLATVATRDRIIGPGLRGFLRRRMKRAVEELNKRLDRPIQPFKLMRHRDQVIRLV
jgi:glycerol-3-phosphate O-acyltransferase